MLIVPFLDEEMMTILVFTFQIFYILILSILCVTWSIRSNKGTVLKSCLGNYSLRQNLYMLKAVNCLILCTQ